MTDKGTLLVLGIVVIITVSVGFFVTNHNLQMVDFEFVDSTLAVSANDEINNETNEKVITAYKVNINTASKYELTTVPNITDEIADKILERRSKRGAFRRIEQIIEIEGVNGYVYSRIKDYITVSSGY